MKLHISIDNDHKFLKVFTHHWYVLNQLHERVSPEQVFLKFPTIQSTF